MLYLSENLKKYRLLKNFTQEDIQRIRDFSNPKNRSKGKGTAPFLYNVIYDVETRLSTETHIKTFLFLNFFKNFLK